MPSRTVHHRFCKFANIHNDTHDMLCISKYRLSVQQLVNLNEFTNFLLFFVPHPIHRFLELFCVLQHCIETVELLAGLFDSHEGLFYIGFRDFF